MDRASALLIAGLFCLGTLHGQNDHVLESLRQALATEQHDTVRLKTHLHIAGEWLGIEPDSAYDHCARARELAERTGRPQDIGETEGWLGYIEEQRGRIGLAMAHYEVALRITRVLGDAAGESTILNNLGAIYKDQGRTDAAMAAHERSLSIRRARSDSLGIATSLNNIGLLLYDQGRIPEAMEHYAEAIRYYEAGRDSAGIATILHNIAAIHKDQGDLDEALDYFMRALMIHEKGHDAYDMATTEDNIGGVLEQQGRTSDALVHYVRAMALHEKAGDVRGAGYSLRNIAGIHLANGVPDSALAHALEAFERLRSADDKRGQVTALWMQGRALLALGRTAEAEKKGVESLGAARELGYPFLIRDASQLLGEIYRTEGRWKEALAMQDIHLVMRDSVRNEEARRSAIKQQYRYAYEKKEADLRAEQREHIRQERDRRNILLISGIGLLALAGGLWSRLRFMRRSRAAIQREKEISDGLLLNILPEEVAAELKTKGAAEAKHFDNATILFSDFKGFTAISEKLTAAQLVDELNTCFQAFDHIITARGIEKIKTIGDAYMCVGGLPDPKSSTPADVVRAALEMQDFMRRRKAERDAQGKPAFEMRVGIHTGPVVAGIVGVKKFQYDIWGDTVNTASRMESSGEVGQVNISEATYALVKDETGLTFTPRGKVQAKARGRCRCTSWSGSDLPTSWQADPGAVPLRTVFCPALIMRWVGRSVRTPEPPSHAADLFFRGIAACFRVRPER